MNEALYKEYAELEMKIRMLEESKEKLRKILAESLEANGLEKVDSPYGSFSLARKVKWTYSEPVQKMEEQLKIKKINEQTKGTAAAEETRYLLFKPAKNA